MAGRSDFLRFASPNELRTISREDVGFYHAVIVGALYEFGGAADVYTPTFFHPPLRRCIEKNPYLSVIVGDMQTDKSFFQHVESINLAEHISITGQPTDGDDFARIEEVLASSLDKPFPRGIPPWKITVLPLMHGCFIAFAFSHMIGDGPTGTAFHRAFLDACRSMRDGVKPVSEVIKTPMRPLPGPFDTPQRLPISWSFLLQPLTALVLPSFISSFFGLRASASATNAHTWTGSKIFYNPKTSHSKLKLREIDAVLLENTLGVARRRDAKLTGTFQLIITRALSKAILDPNVTNFVSQTAINMRGSLGIPDDEEGNFASGCYIVHPRDDSPDTFSEETWAAASSATHRLAESASTLRDQAVGLLRYLPSVRQWTLSKLGQQRDCSFEVSNIGAFRDDHVAESESESTGTGDHARARITKMAFAQPGHVTSAPLAFNLVSVQNGTLVYTVSWQAGALGIAEDEEASFVDAVCLSIEKDLQALN